MTTCYQLACGCWQSDPAAYGIGGVYLCMDHGRVLIIGRTSQSRGDGA